MSENSIAVPGAPEGSPFDAIRHVDAYGREYWLGREMQPLMQYSRWEDFATVISPRGRGRPAGPRSCVRTISLTERINANLALWNEIRNAPPNPINLGTVERSEIIHRRAYA